MADNQKPDINEETPKNPNPILSFITNFVNSFKFPFPTKPPSSNSEDSKLQEPVVAADAGQSKSPDFVRVPNKQEDVSLKLEADEVPQDTSPVVLWQVYAIGGFFILKWAWARWNERRAKKANDEDPTNDEDPAPANN